MEPKSICFLFLFGLSFCHAGEIVKVPTTTGILHGIKTTVLQKSLMQFLGVPYAKPPVAELRFQPPVEMFTESVARDSAVYAASCYQPPHMASVISPLLKPNEAEISEDCLYLNLFVPEVHNEEKPLPVMVWLPGEGFDYADPQQYDGSYLAVMGKVIVVTVNYRLSIFGFLSTLSEDAPGNVGLLDQRMALRWLKKNIVKFGGDSENVTLFGRFTGAMSVGIQSFSPLNSKEQLFHRAILQSGVPVGEWVFDKNPINATYRLADASNCRLPEISDTVNCLRRTPSDILLKNALQIPHRWRPVFDYHLVYEDVLQAASKKSDNSIDFLLGMNNDEGSLCTIAMNAMQSPLYKKLIDGDLTESDFRSLVDSNMQEIFKKNDHLMNKMSLHEYSDPENHQRLRDSFVDFCGDLFITAHTQKLADLLSSNTRGRVYMYEFAHRPSFSIHPSFIQSGHGDDVLYTLGLPFQLRDLPVEEEKLTKRAIEAVTNFAKNGNPNKEGVGKARSSWPQYTVTARQIMTFTSSAEQLELVTRSSHDRAVSFWHDVIPTAEHRSCPMSSRDPCLACPDEPESAGTNFLGNFLTLPSSEYVVSGLFCAVLFLFLTAVVAVFFLFRAKKQAEFERLR